MFARGINLGLDRHGTRQRRYSPRAAETRSIGESRMQSKLSSFADRNRERANALVIDRDTRQH